MALPNKRIKKVKLPGDVEGSQTYEIIPDTLQDGTTNNKLSVPTLSNDDTIVTTNTAQTLGGSKTFNSNLIVNGGIRTTNNSTVINITDTTDTGNTIDALTLEVNYADDNFIGTTIISPGHFTAYGDNDDNNEDKPNDETSSDDLDTDYFNTGITLRGDETYKLSFPAKSGILATTNDCTELVDLTEVNTAYYKLSLYEEDGTTYLRLNFSQGYVLQYLEMYDSVNDENFSIEMNYDAINNTYTTDDIYHCSADGWLMTNRTTGGLQNYFRVSFPYFTPTALSDLEMNNIQFIKVEGTFYFES